MVSSEERAFHVGNIFKQTLASNSPKACVLYGSILSDHIGETKKDFTYDELIACNALVNACDYDLDSFIILMENLVLMKDDGKRPINLKKQDTSTNNMLNINEDQLFMTCSWGVSTSNPMDYFRIDNTTLVFDIPYYVERPADILYNWVVAVKQVWDYGE